MLAFNAIGENPRRYLLALGFIGSAIVGAAGCAPSTPAASLAAASPSAATVAPSQSPLVGGVCVPTPIKFDPTVPVDLTGAWAGDDGGIYYVRQRGTTLWWNGMSSRDMPPAALGRDWNNVGHGEIKDDLTVASDWVDVPRGGAEGYGTVDFKIGADSAGNLQITTTSQTGTGRGDSVWTRCAPGFPR